MTKNRADPCRAARTLTTQTWTVTERASRSLDGLQSNRFPEASPKAQATPKKVNAILGKFVHCLTLYLLTLPYFTLVKVFRINTCNVLSRSCECHDEARGGK